MSETAKKIIDRAYDLIEENDTLISITELGLKQAINEELEALKKREAELREAAKEFYESVTENEGYFPDIYKGQDRLKAALKEKS